MTLAREDVTRRLAGLARRLGRLWRRLGPLGRGVLAAFAMAVCLSLLVRLTLSLAHAGQWPEEIQQSLESSAVHLVWILSLLTGAAVGFRRTR